jgi:hypothetical protein
MRRHISENNTLQKLGYGSFHVKSSR